jgi:hypothetical protein
VGRDILKDILDAGFKYQGRSKKKVFKELFPGYRFEFYKAYGNWEDNSDVTFYLLAQKFGHVMEQLFAQTHSKANEYCKRKLIKDTQGGLGMGAAGWEESPAGVYQFFSAATYINHKDLLIQLNDITCTSDLFDFLYNGIGQYILIPVEGIWVFMFMLKEMALDDQAILEEIRKAPENWPISTKKPVDMEMIQCFSDVYNACKTQ